MRFFDRWLKGIPNGADARAGHRLVRARLRRAGAVPGGAARPLAGGERLSAPVGRTRASGGSPAGSLPLVGGSSLEAEATARPTRSSGGDRRRYRTTGRRSAPGRPCRGAPAVHPTASARDLRPDEALGPTYTIGAARRRRSRSSASRRSSSTWPSRPRSRRAVVRLTDVAPDGTSAQVSAGILNLTHRRSHERPGGARARPGRGDPGDPPAGRLSIRRRSPDPGVGRLVGLAGHLAVAVRDGVRAPPRSRDAVAPHPAGRAAGRRPGRRGRPGFQDDAARPAAGRRRGPLRRAGLAGSRPTSSPAASRSRSTTVARTCSMTAAGSTRRRR